MPILINRRQMLAGAAAGLWGASRLAARETSVRWALLSDTHIAADEADTFRGFRPAENLRRAVAEVQSLHFDGHLINGDLARLTGEPADYAQFASLIRPFSSAALTLGNHDDRKHALAEFSPASGERQAVEGKWVSLVDAGPVRILLLDSLFQTNTTPGLLGKSQRDWLAAFTAAHNEKPLVIFVHHTLDDKDTSLLDADRFLHAITPMRHVKAVFYGHSHAYRYDKLDGLHLVNIPAVGYNFEDSEPVGWTEAEFTGKGARLQLHAFAGNRTRDGEERRLEWRS